MPSSFSVPSSPDDVTIPRHFPFFPGTCPGPSSKHGFQTQFQNQSYTPLRQNPRMRFCRMRQPVLQHRCCGLKVLHQQDFQTLNSISEQKKEPDSSDSCLFPARDPRPRQRPPLSSRFNYAEPAFLPDPHQFITACFQNSGCKGPGMPFHDEPHHVPSHERCHGLHRDLLPLLSWRGRPYLP